MAKHYSINRIFIIFGFIGICVATIVLFMLVFPNVINEQFGINESKLLCEDGNEDACKQLANNI